MKKEPGLKKFLLEIHSDKTRPRIKTSFQIKPVLVLLFLLLTISNIADAALISDQGTDVKEKSSGKVLSRGNLTISIHDSAADGNLIFNQTFIDVIANGSWNIMMSPTLEFGKRYWKDYIINGSELDFDGSERLEFESSSGIINNASFINFSLLDQGAYNVSRINTTVFQNESGSLGIVWSWLRQTIWDYVASAGFYNNTNQQPDNSMLLTSANITDFNTSVTLVVNSTSGFIKNGTVANLSSIHTTNNSALAQTLYTYDKGTSTSTGTNLDSNDFSATSDQAHGSDVSAFSESGLVLINDELIYYSDRNTTTLTNLVRGQFGTTADSQGQFSFIYPIQLVVSSGPTSLPTLLITSAGAVNFPGGNTDLDVPSDDFVVDGEIRTNTGFTGTIGALSTATGAFSNITASTSVRTSGAVQSTSAGTLGWSVVASANQKCVTTCVSACVFGQDTNDANKIIVDCDNVNADRCVCAGAS